MYVYVLQMTAFKAETPTNKQRLAQTIVRNTGIMREDAFTSSPLGARHVPFSTEPNSP